MDLKIWDMDTVTVADFSVQVDIPKAVWDKWIKWKKVARKSKAHIASENTLSKRSKSKSQNFPKNSALATVRMSKSHLFNLRMTIESSF